MKQELILWNDKQDWETFSQINQKKDRDDLNHKTQRWKVKIIGEYF
jgi:hypothetical protein